MKGSKRTAKSERSLALSLERRRGKMSDWSETPSKAKVRKGAGVVFSIRFSPDELEELRRRADEQDVTLSEYIRRAALSHSLHTVELEWLRPAGPELMLWEPTVRLLSPTKTRVSARQPEQTGGLPHTLFDDRQKFLLSLGDQSERMPAVRATRTIR
jgi:hypothetical protein